MQLNLLTLTDSQLIDLNAPFTAQEDLQVVKTLPTGKSPSLNGLTNEYYKFFKDLLSSYLVRLFFAAGSMTSFSAEMLTVHVVTLPKHSKDSNIPANLGQSLF